MNVEKYNPIQSKEHAEGTAEAAEEAKDQLEKLRKKYEGMEQSPSEISEIDTLQKRAEALAADNNLESASSENTTSERMDIQKDQAYAEALSSARKGLSGYQKQVSKIIHKPAVEKVSEIANKTILRPSIFTGAMVCMGIGTILLYGMSKYYGYEINATWSLLLLLAGALFGILIELVLKIFVKRRKS